MKQAKEVHQVVGKAVQQQTEGVGQRPPTICAKMYRAAIKNTWTVAEMDFSADMTHLRQRMTPAEQHLIKRLVAFFATGDSIAGNSLVLNLYKHVNSPEARMYLSRQLFEEAQHVEFYLTLLDTYIPDQAVRKATFDAAENIPSIREKAEFCFQAEDLITGERQLSTKGKFVLVAVGRGRGRRWPSRALAAQEAVTPRRHFRER